MSRPHRAITLRPEPLRPEQPLDEFSRTTKKVDPGGDWVLTDKRWREGDVLHVERVKQSYHERNGHRETATSITRYTVSCLISFDEILACIRIEDDDDTEAPWDHCDGWEHEVLTQNQWLTELDHYAKEKVTSDNFRDQFGSYFERDNCETMLIRMIDAHGNGQAVYDHLRYCGASRQVAAELQADWKRDYIKQLREWYEHGWNWYGVVCEFSIAGKHYVDSCWGIDNEEYAERHVKHDVASCVGYKLEQDGFIVVNQPYRGYTARSRILYMRERANEQNRR